MKKRSSQERREFVAKVDFPFTDRTGCVIPFNRSRQPERRMNSYVLQEDNEEEFLLACINFALQKN